MRNVTAWRWAIAVTLLLVASAASAVDEPLKSVPIAMVDHDSHVPLMAWSMRAEYAPAMLQCEARVYKGTVQIASDTRELGDSTAVISTDTDWHDWSYALTYLYPSFPSTVPISGGAGLADGNDYVISFRWAYHGASLSTLSLAGSVPMRVVNGFWTQGEGLIPPPESVPDGTGRIKVWARHNHIVQSGYLVSVPGGGLTGGDVQGYTGTDGSIQFDVHPGSYGVQCAGIPANGTAQDAGVRSCLVILKQQVGLVFDFDDSGKDTAGSGGSPGSPDQTSGQGGWIADVMKYLFVPKQSKIDALKTQLNTLFSWGPFGLIGELVGIGDTSAGSKPSIGVPVLGFGSPDAGGGLYLQGVQSFDFTVMTGLSCWSGIRTALGLGVYLGFAMVIVKRFQPQQVV